MRNLMKNVDGDYLWDKSGEPDPEIQELEQVLGTLRYQPRPLEIPEGLQPERQRFSIRGFAPRLAIAAAIALIVLGAGLWLSLERQDTSGVAATETKPAASGNSSEALATVPSDRKDKARAPEPGSVPINPLNKPRRNRLNQTSIASNANRKRDLELKRPELAANELKEAESGKAQLMLALRIASAKLNFALKKAQGTNNGNLIQNQHKIG